MEVEVISWDTIKPSSPTPDHLRLFKLSLFDQLAPPIHVPIILFYEQQIVDQHDSPGIDMIEKYKHRLKKSLSDSLTRFYPLAGRFKDDVFIDCNDDGVDYIEATVNCELTKVMKHLDVDMILKQFFPCEPYSFGKGSELEPILSIQVNFFECGGMAIGLCISHKIADASSLTTFIQGWAATSCGSAEPVGPRFELASLFPPMDLSGFMPNTWISKDKVVTKRFVFDASKIAALKTQASQGSSVGNPTRVEAVTAFILRRLVHLGQAKAKAKAREDEEEDVQQYCSYAASHAVNLRGRMVPSLERNSFGNMTITSITEWAIDQKDMDEHRRIDLVSNLRDMVKKNDNDFVRRLEFEYFDFIITNTIKFSQENLVKLCFSSWCRFPYYETDFGWGKPAWVSTTTMPFKDVIVFMDTRSGDGIEAIVNMLEEDMKEFESDPDIRVLACSTDDSSMKDSGSGSVEESASHEDPHSL